MGRPVRIQYPGALYHITSRGNERREVFRDDADRKKFLEILKDYHERHSILIHCFVLMGNHYHLVMETVQGNLVKVMHGINGGYTGYFNRKYNRAGHLFQGRYGAIVVDKAHYLLELSRYVHLNPVRAGMVARPEQYRWSSCPGYVSKAKALDWIEYGWVLSRFGDDPAHARKGYRTFVHAGVKESPFKAVYGQVILGPEGFLSEIKRRLPGAVGDGVIARKALSKRVNPERLIRAVAVVFGVDEASLKKRGWGNRPRGAAIYLIKKYAGLDNREIGAMFGGVHPSTVSKASVRFAAELVRDRRLSRLVKHALSNARA